MELSLSQVIKKIRGEYPEEDFKIGSLKNNREKWYVTVKKVKTGEEIKLEITDKSVKIESSEYTIEQFDDEEGKFEVDDNGNIIDDSDDREDDDDAR